MLTRFELAQRQAKWDYNKVMFDAGFLEQYWNPGYWRTHNYTCSYEKYFMPRPI